MPVPHIKIPPPGPRARAVLDRDRLHVSGSYPRSAPFVMARGAGSTVEDVDGNVYLDCCAGIAVNATGHGHPEVLKAIQTQAERFVHISTDFYHEPQVALAEAIQEIAPFAGSARTFFSNSGTEAVEAAIKLARYHTGRPNIIAFLGSFHGRTLGALSLTASKAVQRRGFGPMMAGVFHAPYANPYRYPRSEDGQGCAEASLEYIEKQILVHLTAPEDVAAIIFEPIQGEGGYVFPPIEFVEGLGRIARQHGMLLIADEVQSGVGRTGKMFAIEHTGVKPDIVIIAKGIASGLPMGLTIAHADVMDWPEGAHSNTFGGNPVACAAALATIRLVQRELMGNAARVGQYFLDALQALAKRHALIGEVRGKGLMIGIELVKDRVTKEPAPVERDQLVMDAFTRGLLILSAGRNVVRICPPLVFTMQEAQIAVRLLDESLTDIASPD